MTAAIKRAFVGTQDRQGDIIRRMDASLTGGNAGPIPISGNVTVADFGGNKDGPQDTDAFYVFTAAGNLTLPAAANCPLGVTVTVAGGHTSGTATIKTADSVNLSSNATATTVAGGARKSFTLAETSGNLASPSYLWV